jgi:membrane protein implicated in regulation of membrane protease activity
MIWWYWILFGLGLLVLELFLPSGFFIFFFGVGALLTGALVGFIIELDPSLQWAFCSIVSIILALSCRKFLMGKLLSPYSFNNNPEGREVIVSEGVSVGASGSCEFRGSRWTIRNAGDQPLEKGDKAIVERREGLALIVRKVV